MKQNRTYSVISQQHRSNNNNVMWTDVSNEIGKVFIYIIA